MDFNKPYELLNILLATNVDYEDLLNLCEILLPKIKESHTSLDGTVYPSALSQCILECYKVINNFSESRWISSKKIDKNYVKSNNTPIEFKRLCARNEVISYKIYNANQLENLTPEEIEKFTKRKTKKKKQEEKIKEKEKETDENILRILNLIKKGENIFITGHAGTGKSYILNKLKEKIEDLVITSTTGIAAVNIKGQTLHSWAGVGICNKPIEQVVDKILHKSSLKRQIQNCNLLAIDEISMLDVKTFEYVDKVLRKVRDCDKPFGGIQVIFIGDFFQLPPVEKEESLGPKYCFESNIWQDLNLHTILLTKNYRQNEENLIIALANMRMNKLTIDDIKLLKTRECFEDVDLSNMLHIFATNQEADKYNETRFNSIDSKEYHLIATDGVIKGKELIETPTSEREVNILRRIDVVCRAERKISLKNSARVMLLINLDFTKGLINGSCGEVIEIEEDYITISFDNGIISKIYKHEFEFYKNDTLIAIRKQFPLRLAYGITIHKSQGMSLDKLVVDCSRIFEKGQTYVALSRIKTLDGLYLKNFTPQRVMIDEKVVNFYENLKIYDEKIENISSIEQEEIFIKPKKPKKTSKPKKNSYRDLREKYSDYIIIQKAGAFYDIRDYGAVYISKELNYTLYSDKASDYKIGVPTGSIIPVLDVIKKSNYKYLITESYQIIEKYDNGESVPEII